MRTWIVFIREDAASPALRAQGFDVIDRPTTFYVEDLKGRQRVRRCTPSRQVVLSRQEHP